MIIIANGFEEVDDYDVAQKVQAYIAAILYASVVIVVVLQVLSFCSYVFISLHILLTRRI